MVHFLSCVLLCASNSISLLSCFSFCHFLTDWEASVHTGEHQSRGWRAASPEVPVCPPGGRGEGRGPGDLHLHRPEPARSEISVHKCSSAAQTKTQTQETLTGEHVLTSCLVLTVSVVDRWLSMAVHQN